MRRSCHNISRWLGCGASKYLCRFNTKRGTTTLKLCGFYWLHKYIYGATYFPLVVRAWWVLWTKHVPFHIYKTITTLYGHIFHILGPKVGRWYEITLYWNYGVNQILDAHLLIYKTRYFIYGDAAYMLWTFFRTLFPRIKAFEVEPLFNKKMSSIREAME